MANPGAAGNKFVSVNLNKSYGQSSNPNHSNSSSYASGRARSGGGSMVVLSRPRSSHKAAPKLSVPPPLNLPSLRKEHERFDTLGSVGGSVGGGIVGSGAGPSSSGLGWSKPNSIVVVERDGVSESDRPLCSDGVNTGLHSVDEVNRGGRVSYMPPSATRSGATVHVSAPVLMGNTAVLRGEDFPSLRATLASSSSPAQKPKDSTHLKQKQGMGEELSRLRGVSHTGMQPQSQSQYSAGNTISVDVSDDLNSGSFRPLEQGRTHDYLMSHLPLVRLRPRSDWADDERDTSHGLTERDRDHSFSRTEDYWDKDFDLPRSNFLSQKPVQNHFDRRGQRDYDVGKGPRPSSEVSNADPLNKDERIPSRDDREGQSWRHPAAQDGFASKEVISDKISVGSRPTFVNREAAKENVYTRSQFGGSSWNENNGGFAVNRDLGNGRRDSMYLQGGRQKLNSSVDPDNGRGTERNIRDSNGSGFNRYRADVPQNSMGSRSSFSTGRRGPAGSDLMSNFGRGKHSFSRGEMPYMEDSLIGDWGSNDFDVHDPFSAGILGVVKKKKDSKHLNFHDPVRESFEAELERVQKIQEQERQRVIEDQEKVIEIARREEEERQSVAREREEHQRRLEEEAREGAWRAEQEKLEAMRREEEHKLAKEEEKKRLMTEEERRKQAAKQKLQELEERIARREAEAAKADGHGAADTKVDKMPKEKEISRTDEFASWEDGERMVERITNTASSDSSIGRPSDMGYRNVPVTEGSYAFTDRVKSFDSRRRDIFENGTNSSFFSSERDNVCQSPRRDAFGGGRAFPQKDFYGGPGYMPMRGYWRGGTGEPHMEDFLHARGSRWSIAGDGDPYGRHRELETEFSESVRDKFDMAWGPNRSHGCSAFTEHLYENSDLEALYTYGRSRYPSRQPRVLPPPSLSSVHRTSYRNEGEPVNSSTYSNGDIQFNHAAGSEHAAASFQNAQGAHSDKLDAHEDSANNEEPELRRSRTPGRDSQSSLSVSSAPGSPTQLSHDDLHDSREPLAISGIVEDHDVCNSENKAVFLKDKERKGSTLTTPRLISVGDDEEWTVENNVFQNQEEYDEDVRYNEEVQDGDDENAEHNLEFEGMHLEEKGSSHLMKNLVLGFDQGVEVGMPDDECEISPRIVDTFGVGSQVIGGLMESKESFDNSRDGQSLQVADVLPQLTTDVSYLTVQESEKAAQASEPVNAPHTSRSSDPLSSECSSSATVFAANKSALSSVGVTSQSSSQSILPSVAGAQGASEYPVRLQFGLFSGPSLIPSPVPAIQIGSIQMPLQLPSQVTPPLTHMHATQPTVFQFGQIRYPSPISQGISPLVPQSSFLQPTLPLQYPSSKKCEGALSVQPIQDPSCQSSEKDVALPSTIRGLHKLPTPLNVFPYTEPKEANLIAVQCPKSNDLSYQNQTKASNDLKDQVRPELCQQAEVTGLSNNLIRNSKPLESKTSERLAQGGTSSSHFSANLGDSDGAAAQGSESKGRRAEARNPGARLPFMSKEASRSGVSGFQRRPRCYTQKFEFRVRQAADGKQSSTLPPSDYSVSVPKSNNDANSSATRWSSGLKKDAATDKSKQTFNARVSSSDQIIKEYKPARKETSTSRLDTLQRAEGSLKRNIGSEYDVDAPLQSGIVRVFKQPGIEVPSDEDDFIEVRSKRQMLNDRREQREKEIKAKSSNMKKTLRKSFPVPQGTSASKNNCRTSASSSTQAATSNHTIVMTMRGSVTKEIPATLKNRVSQTLAPIGTPSINADSKTSAKTQTMKLPQASSCATDEKMVGSNLTFLPQINSVDAVHSSIQLEEAIDKDMASVGDCNGSITERGMSSSFVIAKDSSLSSATSPISCLLAGERIQFGAVTSPTIIPPSTCVVPHSIRAPASSPLNIKISGRRPASESDCVLLFEKERHTNESCQSLENCVAEAETAASVVAVGAITNDEVFGNGISGRSASMSVSGGFRGANMDEMAEGMFGEQQGVCHPKGEETLSISLPADLSVETPPISLWPPLPSPHGPSSQVPSPFSGGPSSHFPFYDMNPILGGPVFAFGLQEESVGSQSQPQKSNLPSSSPLGTWQQCHPGVYSFYGPRTGLTAPFISPPGTIPEVQGHPHMVVYNHFAPVGQFGQVGLSYMGSTYIPSGKQPDWKHNTSSSGMGGSEGEINRLNVVPVQHSATNIPAHVQHVAPGCPLQPMASPLTMFEVPPSQSGADASVHPHWSHVQATSIHSVPQSMPLQQQPEGAMPAQMNRGVADHHHSFSANGSSKLQTSSMLEDSRSLAADSSATVTHLSSELKSVDSAVSSPPALHAVNVRCKSQPGTTAPDSLKIDAEGPGSKKNLQLGGSGSNKPRSSHQKNPPGRQYSHYLRGGAHKNDSGVEWSSRKMGFHGRSHSSGGERGVPPAKVKQVYVAKQSTSGTTMAVDTSRES